jgi:hypothetical protein
MPQLPAFTRRSRRADYGSEDLRSGFSLDLWVRLQSLATDQMLLDNRTPDGKGFWLRTADGGTLEFGMNDGHTENLWRSDPGVLAAGEPQHIAVIIDGGPKIIGFVVNGKFNDGGDFRQFGWGRFSPNFTSANGSPSLRVGNKIQGEVLQLRIYDRYLRTSEAIASFRAGQ